MAGEGSGVIEEELWENSGAATAAGPRESLRPSVRPVVCLWFISTQ